MARTGPSSSCTVATSSMATCSRALKLLADGTRLAVIQQLFSGPRHVHEINAVLHIDPTLLSHHLRVLREAGLVCADREGKSMIYRLSPDVRLAQRRRVLDFGCCELTFKPVGPPKQQRNLTR